MGYKHRFDLKEWFPDMNSFKLGGNLVHFAAFKDHVSFFPTSSGVAKFKNELEGNDISKGTIRFPLEKLAYLDTFRRQE
jgi:uncharacterized protein YdhG (YjbR/CyaY superfamily)